MVIPLLLCDATDLSAEIFDGVLEQPEITVAATEINNKKIKKRLIFIFDNLIFYFPTVFVYFTLHAPILFPVSSMFELTFIVLP
jgi:hypothetical protein